MVGGGAKHPEFSKSAGAENGFRMLRQYQSHSQIAGRLRKNSQEN
jgi:hypothetical protein